MHGCELQSSISVHINIKSIHVLLQIYNQTIFYKVKANMLINIALVFDVNRSLNKYHGDYS